MMFGLEQVSITKQHERKLEAAESKMLRFSLGVIGKLGDNAREARLRWFGHVKREMDVHRACQRVSNSSIG